MLIVLTPPHARRREAEISNLLFRNGLHILHLRLDNLAERQDYVDFILSISPQYRDRIVVHDHYSLVAQMGLRGVHLKSHRIAEHSLFDNEDMHISVSTHSIEELKNLPFKPHYAFLSPIFDSISKNGYSSSFTEEELTDFLCDYEGNVVALGGVSRYNADKCYAMGFAGVALLGDIWENNNQALERFRQMLPPLTMSIAGFDPSSGAGVSSDIATAQALDTYSYGCCTALTVQNENCFIESLWRNTEEIKRELEQILLYSKPQFIKIGIVESISMLSDIVLYIKAIAPKTKIIWDPILSATAGVRILQRPNKEALANILKQIYLITPNAEEGKELFAILGNADYEQIAKEYNINILLKGGHNTNNPLVVSDLLFCSDKNYAFSVSRSDYDKHGTGCVLSAAITALLNAGCTLENSCRQAQLFVSRYIASGVNRLGHYPREESESKQEKISACNLQFITDKNAELSICEQVEAACRGGVKWVQLRMKDSPWDEIIKEGKKAALVCQKYGAVFIVNDSVEAALALNADGVHLGLNDINPIEARKILGHEKIIGGTCNSFSDVLSRVEQGADYIGLGPFNFTDTKKNLSTILHLQGIADIVNKCVQRQIDIPIYAIGGIVDADIPLLMATGIQGVVLSSLLRCDNNMEEKSKEIIDLINSHKNENSYNCGKRV